MSVELRGKGIYAWILERCEGGDMKAVASRLKSAGMTHVLPKIADGISTYTRNWLYLPALVDQCHKVGIKVIGWQYVYGTRPAAEADRAVAELNRLPFDGFVINAEQEYRDLANNDQAAKIYCERIRASYPDILLGLSTYRYPHYHRRFPFTAFLTYCDVNMPQVYWMQANGTVPRQLADTITAYRLYPPKPIIPTGAAFAEHGWTAIPGDQGVFVDEVLKHGLSGCNWWEYYEAFHKNPQLGQAIAAAQFAPPEEETVLFRARCITTALNVRSGPGAGYEKVGLLRMGDEVDVYEVSDNNWYRLGAGLWCSGYEKYMERLPEPEPEPEPEPDPEQPELTLEERVERLEKAVFG